ncbi:hypothetical protein JCM6882_002115 [Rhodosporidiobolus microsporus]
MSELAINFLASLAKRHTMPLDVTEAEAAEAEHDPWHEGAKYAKGSVIFLSAAVGLFGVLNLSAALLRTSAGARITRSPAYRRSVALYRYIETSQPKALGFIRFPTAGTIALISVFWAFTLIWTVAVKPYYYSRWDIGSPPIAIRTGMLALGCFPFILAFGAKWNIVGFVVGASHEKLQVFHQWLSHLFLLLSLIHTFPYVVQGTHEHRSNEDGLNPHGYTQLMYGWKARGMVYYWSGIAALVPLVFLCWGSFSAFRNRFYSIFKLLHIVSAILFSAFFYIHCNALLTSWHYLWATAAVYFTSVAARFALLFFRNGKHVPTGRVETLANDALRVTVALPANSGHSWKAGQHYYVNFVKARPFESRPFTITSTTPETLSFILRNNSALGARLAQLAAFSAPTTPLLLDGPCGGLVNRDFTRHDAVVLFAGGVGMSFVAAVLEDLAVKLAEGKKIEVHWAVKSADCATWFDEQLSQIVARLESTGKRDLLSLNLYVTGSLTRSDSSSVVSTLVGEDVGEEKLAKVESFGSAGALSSTLWKIHQSRPHPTTILSTLVSASAPGSTVGVASCGPKSLLTDVRRAVASQQKKLAFGGEAGAAEIELHTEEVEW